MVTIDNITTVSESSQSRADVSVFDFKSNAVHVILDGNGDPWFVAKDVCSILGLGNITEALRYLDNDEKEKLSNFRIPEVGNIGPKHGGRSPILVSEPGLYNLISHSRKPEAKPFQRWVNHEVLPTIRQTGGYNTAMSVEALVDNPDLVIGLATRLKQARAACEKAEAALNDFTSPAGSYSLRDAAKILNRTNGIKTGGTRLSRWLVEHNWGYREQEGKESYLIPYQKTVESGLMEVRAYKPFTDAHGKTHRRVQARLTGRGLERIRMLMMLDVHPDEQSTIGGRDVDLFTEIED